MLHFHPDRFGRKPVSAAESLLSEGVYRNQFETGLSSGSTTGFPDGERDIWERALFGSVSGRSGWWLQNDPNMDQYGSAELVLFPDGTVPRFWVVLFRAPRRVARTSITFMGSEDSHDADRTGTLATPHAVMGAALAACRN